MEESPTATTRPRPKATLLADHIQFLRDILKHEGDGLKRRYDRLGWGIPKGNRVLRELEDIDLVTVDEVKSENPKGGRSRLVPSLTPAGHEMLQAHQTTP